MSRQAPQEDVHKKSFTEQIKPEATIITPVDNPVNSQKNEVPRVDTNNDSTFVID